MIRRPAAILTLLTALNFINYLDRYELAAVLTSIQKDLVLSNFQGGLLFTVFLVSFLATCPIFGFLGDRIDRKYLLTFGAFAWSLATIATGLANSVTAVFIARACVGIGEASFTTLAPTIIDDIAPADRKGKWLSYFFIAGPVGSALGYIVGGIIGKHWGWHTAFFVGGAPGIALGVLVMFIAEPPRSAREKPEVWKSLRTLAGLPQFRKAVLGYAAITFAVGGFAAWAPAFLFKRFGFDLAKGNIYFGAMTVVAGTIATLRGGAAGDRAQAVAEAAVRASAAASEVPERKLYRESQRERPLDAAGVERAVERARIAALLRVCALGSLVAAPMGLLAFFAPVPTLFFAAAFVCELGVFWNNAPINAAILRAVPQALRASAMAISITSIHLLGDLWSPAIVGRLADWTGDARIQWALLPLPLAMGLSALIWWPFKQFRDVPR